jgi:O-antigen/teichoic acid export membrane protein
MIRRVGVNSAWLILQPLVLNALTLVAMGYITRRLGESGYGLFNRGFAYVALFAPLANLGLRTVGVRAMAERRESARELFGTLLALRLSLALGVGLLALGSMWWFEPGGAARVVIALAALQLAFQTGAYTLGDYFRAFEEMRPVALADMVGGLLLTALSVLALALGYGWLGYTIAYVAGTAIGLLLLLLFFHRRFGWPRLWWEGATARALLGQARPFFLMQLVAGVTDKPCLDLLILGWAMGDAAVGRYAAVALLVNRLGIIPQGVTGALFPAVASGYSERRAEVEQTVRHAILYPALITLPLAAGISFLAGPMVAVLFGPRFAEAGTALQVLIWVVPLLGPNLLMYDCLAAVRRQNVAAAITIGGGLLLIALYAVFIPLYGPLGAAASTVAREALLFVILFREMRRSFTDPVPFHQLGKAALALAAMTLPLAGAALAPSLPFQLGGAAAGAALYAVGLLKLGLVRAGAVRQILRAARAA